ncbi:MAG TPA: MFS transporter [Natronosporangium sp.]
MATADGSGPKPEGPVAGAARPALRWSVAGLRDLWRQRGFPRLLSARVSSLAADAILQTSLAGVVFFNPERATTAGQAAAGFAVLLLPYSLVGPVVGVWLDRWRRARVLVVSNLVRAALVVAVAGLLATTGPTGPLFYLTALAALSVNRFHGAAAGAAIPHVVTSERLVLANAVWTALGLVGGLAGGAVGIALRHLVGAGDGAGAAAALVAAGVYIGSSLVAAGFAAEALGPDHATRQAAAPTGRAFRLAWRNLVEGARYAVRRRPVAAGLLAIGVHRFCYGISSIAVLLLYRNYFTDDGLLWAGFAGAVQVVVAVGIGSAAASLLTPVVVARWSVRGWLVSLLAAAALAQAAFGSLYQQAPLLVVAFVLGMVAQSTRICVEATIQQEVEDDLRGRVFSLYDAVFQVCFVAAAAMAAVTLPDTGKSHAVLGFVAAAYAVAAAGYAWLTRPAMTGVR